jgi:hypothetical protein
LSAVSSGIADDGKIEKIAEDAAWIVYLAVGVKGGGVGGEGVLVSPFGEGLGG